jgi:23S rRNA (pseudouridine1915-N3)-methyltransferase
MIAAIGRLKGGPEAALVEGYLSRASAAGRALGLSPFEHLELDSKPPSDPRKEAGLLLKAAPDGARTVLLDERGAQWTSREMAQKLAAWRDNGTGALCFWIGGPDGAAQGLKDQAHEKLAFGRQTWPHRLVRAMLAEQLYRAVSILGHAPYHRD